MAIRFSDCVSDDMAAPIIGISDGVATVYAAGVALDDAIAAYTSTYGYNDPGEVHCVASVYLTTDAAYERDSDASRDFTIRSV